MDLFITTFESVAVLIGIGLIGFYIIKKEILPNKVLSVLSPLALEIALPSLVFSRIITTFTPQEYPDWWLLPIWWGIFTLISLGLTLVLMNISEKKTKSEFAISLFYNNAIFFPLAILSGIFPNDPSYLVYLFFFLCFFHLCFSAPTFYFLRQGKKLKSTLEE